MDACHWCSLSYRGMSSRIELWMMSLAFVAYHMLLGWWVYAVSPMAAGVLDILVEVLLFYPLIIRRARQTGLTAYGVIMVAAHALPLALSCYHSFPYGYELEEEVPVLYCLFYLMLIPLYFYGGTFSGSKNELHRAAIAGDRGRVERLLAYFPSGLMKKSQKGRTPREYAQEAGHPELAVWLAEQEAQQKTAAE